MPTVRGRRYPYTPSGMRAARLAAGSPTARPVRRRRPMGAARPMGRPVRRPMRRPSMRRYV